MKTVNKPKRYRKIQILISILVAVVVILGHFLIMNHQDNQRRKQEIIAFNNQATQTFLNHKEAGELIEERYIDEEQVVIMRYPSFDEENIDNELKRMIDIFYNDFKNKEFTNDSEDLFSRPILNSDYNSYQINERFVSLYFHFYIDSPQLAHSDTTSHTLLIDLQNNTVNEPLNFFKEGVEQELAFIANHHFTNHPDYQNETGTENYQSGIQASNENYKQVILKNQSLELIFERYQLFAGYLGEVSVEISYDQISNYLKYDERGQEIIVDEVEERKLVAFTFDDGPHSMYTERIVDTFKKTGGHATFFVLGDMVERHPDTLQYVFDHGHQIGNHTYSHPNLTQITDQEVLFEINKNNELISNVIGEKARIVRPTYGAVDNRVSSLVKYPLINWNIDPRDWSVRDTQEIVSFVLNNIEDNGIIIMHDIYETTAQAMEILLPILQEQGYEFVTIEELAFNHQMTLNPGEVYRYIQ